MVNMFPMRLLHKRLFDLNVSEIVYIDQEMCWEWSPNNSSNEITEEKVKLNKNFDMYHECWFEGEENVPDTTTDSGSNSVGLSQDRWASSAHLRN